MLPHETQNIDKVRKEGCHICPLQQCVVSYYDIAVTKRLCKCSGGRDDRPLLVVVDGNDSFSDGLLKLDGETTGCVGVQFVITHAGFNLSTVTVSDRPLLSKVKYFSVVEIMRKGPL